VYAIGGGFAPSAGVGGPSLPASTGQSLVVNGVTVTLASANVDTSQDFGGPSTTLTVSLHCWNQTQLFQSVNMGSWRLYVDGGITRYFDVQFSFDASACSLSPNQTSDALLHFDIAQGEHGPYTLQSDFTTPQGQPLAWTFNA
jgi:hypothetical protein